MGWQFENLVVHNSKTVWRLLSISPEDMEDPVFQKPWKYAR